MFHSWTIFICVYFVEWKDDRQFLANLIWSVDLNVFHYDSMILWGFRLIWAGLVVCVFIVFINDHYLFDSWCDTDKVSKSWQSLLRSNRAWYQRVLLLFWWSWNHWHPRVSVCQLLFAFLLLLFFEIVIWWNESHSKGMKVHFQDSLNVMFDSEFVLFAFMF